MQDVGEPLAGVHRPRVDRRERVLAGEPALARGEPELVAEEVHHVGAVGLVEDGEVGRETERATVEAEQPVADRVERAAPDATGSSFVASRAARETISRAARRLNVRSRIRSGRVPRSISEATRAASVIVLPLPAPATIEQRSLAVADGGLLLRVQVLEHAFEG